MYTFGRVVVGAELFVPALSPPLDVPANDPPADEVAALDVVGARGVGGAATGDEPVPSIGAPLSTGRITTGVESLVPEGVALLTIGARVEGTRVVTGARVVVELVVVEVEVDDVVDAVVEDVVEFAFPIVGSAFVEALFVETVFDEAAMANTRSG